MSQDQSGKRLTAAEKLDLVLGSYQANNIAEYCRDHSIDRSYLYQLRREHETMAIAGWEERRVGRPPRADDANPESLRAELEQARKELEAAREEARKWEARAELQGFYLEVAEDDLKKKLALPNRAARRRAGRKGG